MIRVALSIRFGKLQVVLGVIADAGVADGLPDLLLRSPEGLPLEARRTIPGPGSEVGLPVDAQGLAQALAPVQEVDLCPRGPSDRWRMAFRSGRPHGGQGDHPAKRRKRFDWGFLKLLSSSMTTMSKGQAPR